MVAQTFQGVTPERWESLKTMFAHEANVTINSDEGSAESHGIQFAWLLASETLLVTIKSISWTLKALGMTEESVMGKFSAWINGVQ